MKITGYISQPEKNLYMQSVTPFGREISYFFNAIKNDTDISDIARDGIVATDVIDGIYRSAATRCEVKL